MKGCGLDTELDECKLKNNEQKNNEHKSNEQKNKLERYFHVNEELKQPQINSSVKSCMQHQSDILEFLRFKVH